MENRSEYRTGASTPLTLVEKIAALRTAAIDTGVELCWKQWSSLGAPVGTLPDHRLQSVVDPEGLILASLAFRVYERRLDDCLGWFARVGSHLLSTQRFSNLRSRFPESLEAGAGAFARLAFDAGDRRWKVHAVRMEREGEGLEVREGKGNRRVRLSGLPPLTLRLRSGFGVGVKADLLCCLIAIRGDMATVRELAEALAYTEIAIRAAASDMVAAGFIEESSGRPAYYGIEQHAWDDVLDLGISESEENRGAQHWGYWVPSYLLLLDLIDLGDRVSGEEISLYVRSSAARDLAGRHRWWGDVCDLLDSEPDELTGGEYLDRFCEEAMNTVADLAASR